MAGEATSEVSFVEARKVGRDRTSKNMIDRLSNLLCLWTSLKWGKCQKQFVKN